MQAMIRVAPLQAGQVLSSTPTVIPRCLPTGTGNSYAIYKPFDFNSFLKIWIFLNTRNSPEMSGNDRSETLLL